MIARISEVVHDRTGWCPNAHAFRTRNPAADQGTVLTSSTLPGRGTGPSGADGSAGPRGDRYNHTQRGTLIIGAVLAAILVILITTLLSGIVWVAILVAVILILVLSIMSTLTVHVDNETLRIRFGPVGLVRKQWPVREIVSVSAVKNPWYYGYGLRITPAGPLYNVSGSDAVEVRLVSGKAFRIGTDEPEALKRAIEQGLRGHLPDNHF